MDVLAGGDGTTTARPRSLRRRSSRSFSPGDMLLFRAPAPTYLVTAWPGELCVLGSAVCLALERIGGASKVALFCHGTSSDLGLSRRSLDTLRERLDCHVVAVEYPGYGLTKDDAPTEERLNEAVRSVFLHLTGPMAWARERVVIIGRSLGSGPATFLAREFHPGALLLLAPFSSVKEIAGGIVGDTLANVFNLNHWNNLEKIRETPSPTLFLHGLKDEVVPHSHSLDLYKASCAKQKYVGLLYESDHNRINWKVACDVYAKPFLEKACPTEINRTLGIRARDVSSLIQFIDTTSTTNPAYIVPRAMAAWRQRRAKGGVEHEAAIEAGELAITRAAQARAAAAAAAAESARRAEAERAVARAKAATEASILPKHWKWPATGKGFQWATRSKSAGQLTTLKCPSSRTKDANEKEEEEVKERGRRKEGEEKSQRQHKTIAEFDERRASATNKKRIYDKAGQKDCNECDVSGVVGKGSKPRISIGKGCAGEGAGEGVASSSPLGSAAMRLGFAGFFSAFGSTADASNNENGDSSTDEDNRATEGEPMTEAAEEMSREAGIKDSLQIRSIGESEGAEDATANLECASCGGCSRCDSLKGRNECDVHGDTATKQNVPLILGRQAGTADGANGVVSPPLLGSARFSSFGGFFASFGATADASKNTDNVSQETGDRKPAQEQPATEVTEEAGVGVRTKQVTADKMWTLAAGEVEGEASPPGSATRLSLSDFFTGFGASADVNNNDSGSIAEDETLMEDSPPTEIAEKAVTAAGKSELLREKTSPLGSARMLSFGGFFSGFGGISADTSNDADTGSTEDQLTQEQPAAAIVIEEAGGSGAAREESLLDQATPKLDDSSGREPCNGRSEPGVNAVGEEEKTRASFRVQAGEGGSDNVVNPLGSARRSLGGFFSSFGASVDASNNANSSSAVAPRTADVCSSGASRPQLYGGAVEGKENISFAGSAGAGAKDARDYEGTSEVEKAGNDYTSARNREDRDSGASCPESIGDKNDPGNGPRWKGLATLFSIKAGVAFNVEESRKRRATVKKQ